MIGKLIVIEGTDCSGKETQSKLLLKKLKANNIKVELFSFPKYDTATGKIVAGPILGKDSVCDGYFEEGASNVNPYVFSLYLAADRKYNIESINNLLKNGTNVILDRYTYSNMALQGAKLKNDLERINFFKWIEKLEFELLELPKSDINIFLHMPTLYTTKLANKRGEKADQNEKDIEYQSKVEDTYFLLANKYNFKTIECVENNNLKSIEEINNEVYQYVIKLLK